MFLCRDCLKPTHQWKVDLSPSFGPCEECHCRRPCVDVSPECSKTYVPRAIEQDELGVVSSKHPPEGGTL